MSHLKQSNNFKLYLKIHNNMMTKVEIHTPANDSRGTGSMNMWQQMRDHKSV